MTKENELPVYVQIHDTIKHLIEEGKWQVGDRLPSERELAIQFGVSRMTLRQAIQSLADEGILERKVGSGTYVARQKVQEKMSGVTSFTDIITAQGKVPSSQTISFRRTTPTVAEAEALELADGEFILRMERIRFANQEPICFETTSVPYEYVRSLSRADITTSLYHSAEKQLKLKFGHAEQKISAALANERIAELLSLKRGDAVLLLKQITYLQSGAPFEYVRTQYAGNRFEFFLEK